MERGLAVRRQEGLSVSSLGLSFPSVATLALSPVPRWRSNVARTHADVLCGGRRGSLWIYDPKGDDGSPHPQGPGMCPCLEWGRCPCHQFKMKSLGRPLSTMTSGKSRRRHAQGGAAQPWRQRREPCVYTAGDTRSLERPGRFLCWTVGRSESTVLWSEPPICGTW